MGTYFHIFGGIVITIDVTLLQHDARLPWHMLLLCVCLSICHMLVKGHTVRQWKLHHQNYIIIIVIHHILIVIIQYVCDRRRLL